VALKIKILDRVVSASLRMDRGNYEKPLVPTQEDSERKFVMRFGIEKIGLILPDFNSNEPNFSASRSSANRINCSALESSMANAKDRRPQVRQDCAGRLRCG